MNEKETENLSENKPEVITENVTIEAIGEPSEPAEEDPKDTEEDGGQTENEETPSDEAAQNKESPAPTEEAATPLTDAECRHILSNPMFYSYAKGRSGSVEELIAGFHEMMSLGGASSYPAEMKATPASRPAKADFALSERQKSIARDAGMSYREYYSFLKTMRTR